MSAAPGERVEVLVLPDVTRTPAWFTMSRAPTFRFPQLSHNIRFICQPRAQGGDQSSCGPFVLPEDEKCNKRKEGRGGDPWVTRPAHVTSGGLCITMKVGLSPPLRESWWRSRPDGSFGLVQTKGHSACEAVARLEWFPLQGPPGRAGCLTRSCEWTVSG